MIVTADLPTSANNVRAIATLTIDFQARPVPAGGAGALVFLLLIAGVLRLKRAAAAEA
jgi:hypothetical protein